MSAARSAFRGNRYSPENVMRDLRLYADYGVTTVVSLGDDQAPTFALRDSQRTATLDRARVFAAARCSRRRLRTKRASWLPTIRR
jgi:hypothetical protein